MGADFFLSIKLLVPIKNFLNTLTRINSKGCNEDLCQVIEQKITRQKILDNVKFTIDKKADLSFEDWPRDIINEWLDESELLEQQLLVTPTFPSQYYELTDDEFEEEIKTCYLKLTLEYLISECNEGNAVLPDITLAEKFMPVKRHNDNFIVDSKYFSPNHSLNRDNSIDVDYKEIGIWISEMESVYGKVHVLSELGME